MSPDQPAPDAADLQHQVEVLRQQNETLRRREEEFESHRGRGRWRSIVSWVLLVLACILAVVSVLVVFARNEVLDTDSYVSTVTPLASDPAIQTAVAKRVSEKLIAEADTEQRVKNALPDRAAFLAPPITSGLESLTNQVALRFVQSPRFQKLWVAANRNSHRQMVALLTGSTEGALQAKNGEVTVNLTQVERQVKKQLTDRGLSVFNQVPTIHGPNLVLLRSTQLVKAQRLTRALDKLAVVLPIVTLLLFAAAIALARNRRRGVVRAAAGLALSMAVILVAMAVARNQYLSALAPGQSVGAAAAVFDTILALLLDSVRTIMYVAAAVALVAFVAGNRWLREQARRVHAPSWLTDGPVPAFVAVHRRGLQWAVLGVGLFILLVWANPTTLVAVVVLLVTLALIGLVGLLAGRRSRPVTPGPG